MAKFGEDGSNFALVCLSLFYNLDEWILDIGSTFTCILTRSGFLALKNYKMELFTWGGNDNACEITIIDTIQLKTHDESTKILSDVWYVPSMNKCLVSMGVLEPLKPIGFNIVTIKDGILKVMPSKLVVMQGIRKNNLYHF